MCVCVCVCVRVCEWMRAQTQGIIAGDFLQNLYIDIFMCVCVCARARVCTCVCVCACMCTRTQGIIKSSPTPT